MTQQQQQESKSSVKVTLNAKGEAQIELKVYEGELTHIVDEKGDGHELNLLGSGIAKTLDERLAAVIEFLERQRIKVVGRELPDVEQQRDSG